YRVVHDPVPEEPLPQPEGALDDTLPEVDGLAVEEALGDMQVPEAPAHDEPAFTPPEASASSFGPLTTFDLPSLAEPSIDFVAPHADTHRVGHGHVQDIDDDIDVLDTIDVDLFPIFAEEAQELLPQLEGALRQWVARPDNGSARSEVLRNLHTLKGSARLAGALRLGEMVHRMETTAERLGSDVQRGADLEPLQSAFDDISARFEVLRNSDPESSDVVQTAPEQVMSEPVPLLEPVASDVQAEAASQLTATRTMDGLVLPVAPTAALARAGAAVRVRPELLDRLVNQAGEVMTTRTRMESELVTLRGSLKDLTGNLDRLRGQLRDIELQAETQMQSRLAQARDADQSFDPLEFDRFTRVQELTRMMAESVNDVATVQRNLQRAVESTEDSLVAQGRQTRELQRDLLRTRMVEFEGISERLYRVVRQASKETGKQVRLDITGGNIEMDRGVLDRMTAAFE
ncbi:Hpt domain-containing protein, partial [Hydrogenophaga sp.]